MLKPNIKFKNQFEQWKFPKKAAKVQHFWFHFEHGMEVWGLLFGDVETRTFCITVRVFHLVNTSQSTENLTPAPRMHVYVFPASPLCMYFYPFYPTISIRNFLRVLYSIAGTGKDHNKEKYRKGGSLKRQQKYDKNIVQ